MPNYRRARTPGGTYFFTLVSYQRQKILCNDDIRTALRAAITQVRTRLPFNIDALVLMPDHLHAVWTLPADDGDYSVRWSMIKRLVTQRVGGCGAPQELCGAHGAPYGDGNIVHGEHGALRSKYSWGAPYGDGVNGAPQGRVRHAHHNEILRTDELPGNVAHHNENTRMPTTASRLKRREGNIWQRRFWEHQVRDQDDLNRCLDYLHWNPVKHGYASKVADWPYSTFHRFVREGVYPNDWGGQGVGDGGVFGE